MSIIRPWLHIGAYRDTIDGEALRRRGVSVLLHLAADVRHPGMATRYLAVEDGEPLPLAVLRQGVDFVLDAHRHGHTVLIACGAGISRSATFATATLVDAEGLGLLDAALAVRRAHPPAFPHPALWDSLCEAYGEPIPFLDLLRALNR